MLARRHFLGLSRYRAIAEKSASELYPKNEELYFGFGVSVAKTIMPILVFVIKSPLAVPVRFYILCIGVLTN